MKIAFSRTDGFTGLLTRFVTKTDKLDTLNGFNHCAMLINQDMYIIDAMQPGVRTRSLASYLTGFPDTTIVDFKVPNESKAIEFVKAQEGKKYDYLAIPAFVAPNWMTGSRNWQDEYRWFCSEMLAVALINAGVQLPEKSNFVSPNDLYTYVQALPIQSVDIVGWDGKMQPSYA